MNVAVGFVLITTEPGEEVSVRNSLDSVEGGSRKVGCFWKS